MITKLKTKEPRFRKLHELGPLHDLLLKCAPPDSKNEKSIPILADALGLSSMAIYKWISDSSVPSKRVNKLVNLSKGAVTREEFDAYIYGATE